jgi:hypothetical protein
MEKIDLLSYADLPDVNTFHYRIFKKFHWLVLPLHQKSGSVDKVSSSW